MYRIKQDADRTFIVHGFDGQPVIRLEAGFAAVIIATFENLSQHEHRGDDYMAGVIAGLMHAHMIKPDAFDFIPPGVVKDIGIDPRLLGPEDA